MTTIAYNHKDRIIAYDSRVTCGSYILSDDFEKLFIKDGVKFIMCGSLPGQQRFINDYPDLELGVDYECHGFMVENEIVFAFQFEDERLTLTRLSFNEARGSGEHHAITAMDCGLSAAGAVKKAMDRDSQTGGRVKELFLKK